MAGLKGVTLQFPIGYTLRDFQYVAKVIDRGHVDPKLLISSIVPLSELPPTLQALRAANHETKVHVAP
jgi:(R,R)-butanediol dehydrogenase/meso-butanediol dehydrogenase/diacetyl reductase